MPGWHVRTEALQREGRLQMMGVIQEQHPDRCRLFMQWKQMDWPVAVDALNLAGFSAVPVTFLIDEHGVVRFVNPKPPELEEFLATTYPAPAALPTLREGAHLEALVRPQPGTPAEWRAHGDALFLWGGPARVGEAIDAYTLALGPTISDDGPLHFRLGTALRRRYDSPHRRAGDFQKAVNHWARALEIDPNQYIWRRRLQQYGPRLEKPYPFYDWVDEARRDIRARGDQPVPLVAEPGGAEVAAPEEFATQAGAGTEPDPDGRVTRDPGRLIRVEATQVPPTVPPGGVARAYLVLRPNEGVRAHWNNEVDPLRVWVAPPPGWEIDRPALTTAMPSEAVSTEPREVQLEVKAPEGAGSGTTVLPAYALYYVCEDLDGMCLYRRQDIRIPVRVRNP